MLRVKNLQKQFVLHLQDGITIPVFDDAALEVHGGECVVLAGASGIGKSTLLRLIYGNYKPASGRIEIDHEGGVVDLAHAEAHEILSVRRKTLGYVSQFLRCMPRKPAIDIVAEPLAAIGVDAATARTRAASLLARLNIPERLFELPPATFSGGEQQRVNIARGFAHDYPVLLLDEPTASLDAINRAVVVEMINEAKERGAAILGIFHDADVRGRVADRMVDVEAMRAAA
jgi:alpha-D-ribose 1-methylphosphonate 5-triphosphate synthase subunit PhnL